MSGKISTEMSQSVIHNLRESPELIKGTVEAILTKEVEFQILLAQEIASMEDPEAFVLACRRDSKNKMMVRCLS